MNYQIKIVRTEPNLDFKDQMNEHRLGNRMFDRGFERDMGAPREEFVRDVLICELTEEQYKKVKAEVIKVFE